MKRKFRLILQRTLVLLAAVSAAAVFCPFVAGAREFDDRDHPSVIIDRFDQDGNGLISSDEFPGPDSIFDELDTDGDGYLSAAEAPTGPPPHGGPPRDLLAELDADGDGLISISEFDADETLFDDLDLDGDGYLTEAELSSGAPQPPRRPGFAADDVDHDGRVSESEFSGPSDLFYDLDADGDGYISEEETHPPHDGGHGPRLAGR